LSAESWRTIEPLLDAALAMTDARRALFVVEACSDSQLRDDLMTMLMACGRIDRRDDFLSQPAAARFASLWEDPVDDSQLNAALADRYVISREIGRGGMGVVYHAHDVQRDASVALKVLRVRLERRAPARFRREIAIAGSLVHANILPVLDSGEDAGRLWYTMPFIDGETLGARLRRDGQLALSDVVRLLRDTASGLGFAHSSGVIHRDLKPDNILLADDRAIIADFGIAKALVAANENGDARWRDEGRTTAGVRVGTPMYMAPEQSAGDGAIDHRADLYALGVIAYQLIAGVVPFAGTSRQTLFKAHLVEAPPPLKRHRSGVPPRLDRLVMQLLAKHVDDRPRDAVEVVAELSSL
ncbi:MAG TPA: serine/threonine-protein kinase, partial [Casimicrobiaceae bacterium]